MGYRKRPSARYRDGVGDRQGKTRAGRAYALHEAARYTTPSVYGLLYRQENKVMSIEEKLKDLLQNGVAADIYQADRAKGLLDCLGAYAAAINAARMGRLFNYLQSCLIDQHTLALTRMYDKPSRHYPTRSIPAVLDLLRANASSLRLHEKEPLTRKLVEAEHDVSQLQQLSDSEITKELVDVYDATLPKHDDPQSSELAEALEGLKMLRDKVIAHNEAVSKADLKSTAWNKAEKLLNYAKDFAEVVGAAYLALMYKDVEGTYGLTKDAQRITWHMKKLLARAGIVDDSPEAV